MRFFRPTLMGNGDFFLFGESLEFFVWQVIEFFFLASHCNFFCLASHCNFPDLTSSSEDSGRTAPPSFD